MSWFKRKRIAHRGSGVRGVLKPTSHLSLEPLEDRLAPTVNYYGGALLTNVEAQAVYYGSGWNSSPYAGQKATLDDFLGYIVNSPYTQALTQAGYGVGSGTATSSVADPANLVAGTTVHDSQIQAELQALVSSGAVAAPDANRLYIIYVQPNVVVEQGGVTSKRGILGYHGAFAGHTATGQAVDIHYAVIVYPGGSVGNPSAASSPVDDLTAVTSHELAEAMTDPNAGYKSFGWYDPSQGEIGDITQQYLTRLNGYLVQRVAGKDDQPLPLTGITSQPPGQPSGLAATQSILSGLPSQISVGQGVTFRIKVAPSSGMGTPTGSVTLMDGNQSLGKVNLGADGQVTVTLYANPGSIGNHTLMVVYGGDNSYQGSVSNAITLTVLPPQFVPFAIWIYHSRRHT
jgi:hypothetical protein